MDVLLTGGAGFLGAHFLLHRLQARPDDRVLCLVRGRGPVSAAQRLRLGLLQAAYDNDSAIDVGALMARVTVVDSDLDPAQDAEAWRRSPAAVAWLQASAAFEVLHAGANLSFRRDHREQVLRVNTFGTRALLRSLQGLPALQAVNYVSTAFVAGTREGRVREDDPARPPAFNNPYEESKWLAEQVVRVETRRLGLGLRILRPSIVIGHSRTLRSSSDSGFYKVLQTLSQYGPRLRGQGALVQDIEIPAQPRACLNLIPVDLVVQEMADVLDAGEATLGKVYHLTNERPLSVADIFFGVAPLVGLRLVCVPHARPATLARDTRSLVLRGLRHYLPYFNHPKEFDRRNMHACGADRHQQHYWLDLVELRAVARAFLVQEAANAPSTETVPGGLDELGNLAGAA
jgi:nucleoside-diphosphate-sugar epimerase